MNIFRFLCAALFILFLGSGCGVEKKNEIHLFENEQLSYNFHIRPILSDKCFVCHGPDGNKREAGLRLDIPEEAYAALKESPGKHAIIPNEPSRSEIFLRISSLDPNEMMPPPESNLQLSKEDIEMIKKWIEQGAEYEPHWAFVPPKKSIVPKINNSDWARNEIDFFIASKMNRVGLKPNPEAKSLELLKRISLDITGLPPTIELIKKFDQDNSDQAYGNIIDYLLGQPSYGEKMAVLWMDISRYADSYGYQDDNIRTQWPYRDWVIHSFNKNLPYDQFITWQLAGDLLPNASKEQILATAFNRNHKYTEEGGVIEEEYRIEYILDKTNTFSKGLLGITMECAQCHDHKYDPFSQENYYQLFSFFNNTPEKGYEGDVSQSKPAKTPILWIERNDTDQLLNFVNHQDTSKLMVSVMDELETRRPTYILDRGVYDAPTIEVFPNTPESVFPFPQDFEKNRLGLAKWTVDKKNPLTARVFVNLVWQEIFGKGIVKSTGDFGMQGELPSHPELLDWLAVDFIENGWNIKRLVKQILSSSTYRQSSKIEKQKLDIDPDNTYLARSSRIRLSAENIRDLILESSGLLVKEIGGPSVKPYQPEGLWEAATSGRGELKTYTQDKDEKLYRRGLYTFIKLTSPPPMPIIFDGSNRDQCEVNRGRTNTPLQALVMLNDPLVLEASRVLAQNLNRSTKDSESKIGVAFQRILCRNPQANELKVLTAYFKDELLRFEGNPEIITQLVQVGESPLAEKEITPELAAMMQVVTALYNLEETITKI
ncbi:PSD1 and planctomycete cytochrome C domain-containing protein [Rhodonellum sp.]|uniref:PSD1 and planctomycete cytochrome C domain-containing protein n=1 Tax=Rhodonellum sp. TaxID=2231180 RepID=UPI002724DC8C|nr:PSD1 and planctomycete cytochrome C domain-containing protein [Rhodonellum sp.]MDO9554853.1 PSD1 and planctomycete cytochrome C domain-containing protein [Rhodonellum sp.]